MIFPSFIFILLPSIAFDEESISNFLTFINGFLMFFDKFSGAIPCHRIAFRRASFPFDRIHWVSRTRLRSEMKFCTLYSTQMASMPFSSAYWAAEAR